MTRIRVVPDVFKLTERRIRLGMNQLDLARKADMSVSHVGMIEASERCPSPAVAKRMSDALEVEFDELFIIDRGALND